MEIKYPQKGRVGSSGGEMYDSAIVFWVSNKYKACVISVPYIRRMYVCIIYITKTAQKPILIKNYGIIKHCINPEISLDLNYP